MTLLLPRQSRFPRRLESFQSISVLSDESLLSLLSSNTPADDSNVRLLWTENSGMGWFSPSLSENRIRFGVLRVANALQYRFRELTIRYKNREISGYYWYDNILKLMKYGYQLAWLASGKTDMWAFANAVSTRFLWFHRFIEQVNAGGDVSVHKTSMFARGMVGVYLNNILPAEFEIKQNTVAFFQRAMWAAIKLLYDNRDVFGFEGRMLDLIEQQYRRAWNEGMRQAGLDPSKDMTLDMEAILQDSILHELTYVPGIASEVVEAARLGSGYEPFRRRVDLWANRYNQIVELALRTSVAGNQRLMWVYDETKEHCETCAALHGKVAFASEWDLVGLHPQNAPNPLLVCGGWACGCSLLPTTRRRSPHVLSTLYNIALLSSE